jgi:hypothetical protein
MEKIIVYKKHGGKMEKVTETPDKRMIMFVKIPEWDSPEQKAVRKIYYPESDSPKYQDGRTVPFVKLQELERKGTIERIVYISKSDFPLTLSRMTAMEAGAYILDTVKKNGWEMNDVSVDAALNHLEMEYEYL